MSKEVKEMKDNSFLCVNEEGKAYWGQPEGYPYKGIRTILDGTFEFANYEGIYSHQITDEDFIIIDSKSYTVIWDGVTYQCVATNYSDMLVLGNLAIASVPDSDTGEPFLFVDGMIAANNTAATHTITVRGETIHPIATEFLPKGYPYKESVDKQIFALDASKIGGNHNFGVDGYIMVMLEEEGYPITNEIFTLAAESFPVGTICKVTWDDDVYLCEIKERAEHDWYLGNLAKTGFSDAEDTGEPFLLNWGEVGINCYIPGKYVSGGNYEYGLHNFTVTMPVTSVVPISPEFLPLATPTAAGTVKQAAAVANVTAAPTAEEFNALLKSLRDAGILVTS